MNIMDRIFANRYKILEEVTSTCLSCLYKALDQNNNQPVAIKIWKEQSTQIPITSLFHFKKEVEAVSKINHRNLVKIYHAGEYEGKYYVVMEFFPSRPLSHYLSHPFEVDKAVEIIHHLSSALDLCHDNGIIHRRINPDNILVSPRVFEERRIGVDGANHEPAIKVTNFGYGSLLDLTRITDRREILTTFGYLSPEASGILRIPIDERSDIYSLGILFYTLLAGELPYQGEDVSTLIHHHIAQRPEPPSKINKAIPPILDQIILRLMAKEPQDRYQSLSGLLSDLNEYRAQRNKGNKAIAFTIGRKDHLRELTYSTPLIGRNEELQLLKSYIEQTTQSHGNLCLVYGDAGIGKTRLVESAEEYIHAVRGIYARAKCDQYQFQTPYYLFSKVIKAYLEKLERRTDQEQDLLIEKMRTNLGKLAGEVVKLAPEITRLIGEPGKLVELESEKEDTRFSITITNFLLSLSTSEIPLILFLDDMQWADEASIELLGRIAERVNSHPILIIMGFRDTEMNDTHPLRKTLEQLKKENIPLREIHLKELTREDMQEIISRILLEDENYCSSLAEDLDKKARGNPFFLIEMLHCLVEEGILSVKDNHYQYDLLKSKEIPIPTDIIEVILKRIRELSHQDFQILSYAAIIGRKIEFEILQEVSPCPLQVVFSAIERGMKKQFLMGDITGVIYFIHDRVREAFFQNLPNDERRILHHKIGNYLEEHHKVNLEPVLFELAHHFQEAGIEEKALTYALQAGEKALRAYAHDQAIRLYEAAREILERQDKTGSTEYIDTLENLGSAYYQAGRFDESLVILKTCESLVPNEDTLRKAQVLSKIGDVLLKKGELQNCEQVMVKALKLLGAKLPHHRITVGLGIMKQLFLHGLHALFPGLLVRKEYSSDSKAEIVIHLLYRLVYLYYFYNLGKNIYTLFLSLNTAEKRLGPSRPLSKIYAVTGMVWSQLGWPGWARRNSLLADKMAEDLPDKACMGLAYAFHAIVENPHRPVECLRLALKAITLLQEVGEYWDLGHALCFRAYAEMRLGKNFDELIEEKEEQITLMRNIRALQNLGWLLGMKGLLLTYIGDERLKTEGIITLEESLRLLEEVNDRPWIVCTAGYLAYAFLRLENYREAIRMADRVFEIYFPYHNLVTWNLDVIGMCAQVYLDTLINKPDLNTDERKKYLKRAKFFCRLARFKGWLYHSYRGWSYQVNGTYQWLKGNRKEAIRTWERGITYLREHTQDSYRLASILMEEASFLLQVNLNSKKASQYLIEAREVFTQLGAKLDLERIQRLLNGIGLREETHESRMVLTQRRHLEFFLSITEAIGSILDLEKLLNKIMDYALKATGAERGILFLYEGAENLLTPHIMRGIEYTLSEETFSYDGYRISLEMIRDVGKTREGAIATQKHYLVLSSEDQRSLKSKVSAALKDYGIKEVMCIPLRVKDKSLGLIYLDSSLAGETFGREELNLMKSFAIQASVSIENARLVKDLLEQDRFMQKMIEQSPDGMAVFDNEMNIMHANQRLCDSLGYTHEELLNLDMQDIEMNYHSLDMSAIREALDRGPVTLSGIHRRKDGSTFPVEVRVSIFEFHGREHFLALAHDLTDRQKREAEQQKIQKLESLGILAGGIAHDFNNLLTTIIGNLSLVEQFAKSGINIFDVLEESKKASQQAKHLTQQLLTFSKGGEPIKRRLSLSKLLPETTSLALSGSQVKCDLHISKELWWAEVDEGQINQAINNLVINARQAMPEGGLIDLYAENVDIKSYTDFLSKGKYIKITIKDHGPGIPEKYLQKIFDPYFTTKQKGSGLGLATTYAIIKKHQGHITVESTIGAGTTFSLYLPALEKEIFTVKNIEEKGYLSGKGKAGKGKVLFMDDQPGIRNLVSRMLSHLGYEVECAQDGHEVIELYTREKEAGSCFDVVILDLTIPGGKGGKETIQELLKTDPRAKVIVSSGYSDDPIMSKYKQYGFINVITKPYEPKELSAVLHRVLGETEETLPRR